MQSQNPNGETPLRELLDDMRREFHLSPHPEQTAEEGGEFSPPLFELESAETVEASTPKSGDFSFIDHLSSREIYQMPTDDVGPLWSTYVPRFTDTVPAASPERSTPPVEQSRAPLAQEMSARAESQAPQRTAPPVKTKTIRIITPVDHSTIDPSVDRIPTSAPRAEDTSSQTRIVAGTAEVSPSLATSPTAEETLITGAGAVTMVEIGGSASDDDVFVLPKRMQSREQQSESERTEEDELRDILATISPLSSLDAPVVEATAPQAPEAQANAPESIPATNEPTATPEATVEEPPVEVTPIEEMGAEITVSVPDPSIADTPDPFSDILRHVSPDYDMPKASEPAKDTPFSTEFTTYAQQATIKDTFLDKILSVKVRLICAGLLTLALLVLALLPLFGINLVEKLSLYRIPGVMAIVDMQGVLCLLALAFPELLRAWRDIFKGKVRSEFFLFIHFVLMLLYTVFVVILKPVQYPLFGSLFGMLSFLSILSSHYMHKAQFLSFRLLSLSGEKTVCLATPTQSLVHEKFALDGVIDEYKSKCARFFRASFVDGFVTKNKKTSENSIKILTIVCISLVSSLVVGLVSFILKDMRSALYSFMCVFSFASPLFYVLSHKLSYFKAERIGLSEDATVVGEDTLMEYAGVDVLTYQDTEIFGVEDVALRRFKLIGEEKDFTKPLRQMASLFGAVGGPLATLFDNALERSVSLSKDVTIETDGIYGTVDGVMVYAGSEAFMHRHQIEIPVDDAASGLEATPTTKVLYSAQEGRVRAKFYIRYSFSEEFTMLLPSLREAGITPLIYTRDPNITPDLLRALTLGGAKVRVMKKYNARSEDNPLYPRLDGGIVTLGERSGMLNMLLLAKRYRKFTRTVEILLLASTLVGALLGGLLSILYTPMLSILAYMLWHGAWLTFFAIFARVTFRLPKKSQKEK